MTCRGHLFGRNEWDNSGLKRSWAWADAHLEMQSAFGKTGKSMKVHSASRCVGIPSQGFWPVFLFTTLLVIPEALAQSPPVGPIPKPTPAAVAAHLEKLSVEELIDRLQDLTSTERLPTSGWGIGDPVPGDPPSQRAMGARLFNPKTPPVVRELLRRGLESLPKLLDHLEDKRPTKIVLSCFAQGSASEYFSNEYDSRFKIPAKQPKGTIPNSFDAGSYCLNATDGFEKVGMWDYRYTVKVGDLCFFIIGEMVNRDLQAVVFRDNSAARRIGSPSRMPALARACREEWAGLTAEQHKAFLVEEGYRQFQPSFEKSPAWAPLGALTRLYFYYPEEGEKRIINHIKKPAFDRSIIDAFLVDSLLLTDKNHECGRAYSEFGCIIDLYKVVQDSIVYLSNLRIMSWKTNHVFFYINDRFRDLLVEMLLIKAISLPSDAEYNQLLDNFRRKYGDEIVNQIPIVISYYYSRDDVNDNILYVGPLYKSKMAIKKLFPKFDKNECKFISSIDKEDLERFIKDLPDFSNKKIDQAIFEVFQQASAAAPDREEDHWLAKTCLSRLVGKSFDAQLRPYLVKRIEDLKTLPDLPNRAYQLKAHLDLLNQLKR